NLGISPDEWGVSPDKDLEVKLNPEQYLAYARARRQRDLLSSRRGRKPDTSAAEAPKGDTAKDKAKEKEAKDKDEAKAKEKAKADKKPFVDLVLEKALATIKEELAAATAKK